MGVVQEAVVRLGDRLEVQGVAKMEMVETQEVGQVEVLRGRSAGRLAEMGRLVEMGRLTVVVQMGDITRMKDLLAMQRGTYLSTL